MSESPKNIVALIAALEELKYNRKLQLAEDRDLYEECVDVFNKLKLRSDFVNIEDDLGKLIDYLGDLPPEIKEQNIDELGIESEDLESKALNKEDLKALVEEYEKSQNPERKERLGEEIYRRTGKRNVDQFIKTQKEIAARNAEQIKKLTPKLKQKITADIAKVSVDKPEEVAKVLEKAVLEDKYTQKDLEKEIRKTVKEPEEVSRIVKKVEEVRAEIKVEMKAEEIATRTYEKLKSEDVPVSRKLKSELKKEILVAVKTGEELKLPKQLEERAQDVSVVAVKKEVENFKQESLEDVVNYRAIELEKKISTDLRRSGVRDEALIEEYTTVVKELTYNPETTKFEVNHRQVEGEVKAYLADNNIEAKLNPIFATEEAEFMAKNVVMAPKKFNRIVGRYNEARTKLEKLGVGVDKLPKIKEVRVVEKLMNQFNKYPQVLRMMNNAQRVVGFFEKVGTFPGSVLAKIGVKDVGMQVLGKIGGQAAVDLVKNAAMVMAEQGTAQGLRSIATALFTKGAVVAGEGAAAGGALAGAVAAFQALPVVGQIIAVAVGLVLLVKPIIDGVKNAMGKVLNMDMNGVSHFLGDTLGLGKVAGGVGQFIADIAGFVVGIPALLALVSFTAIVTPVMIFFFSGFFVYSMLQQNLVSSLVPPADMSNCVLKDNSSSGNTNCDPNAPENSWPAVDKANFIDVANRWQAGTNFASVCYNDVVNRALCAGINPTYALWTWLHESGASNYATDDVEDFGIHFIPENKNFNAQITAFLKLDPASACINDPRIGGDYWLAFSANFLNGDCDPDKGNSIFPDATPRKYAAELRETWSWISNAPMPNSIHVAKGGQNCGSLGSSEPLPGNAKEVVIDGKTYICTENTQEPGGDYDPNSPGLDGVVVDGECSVGDVVVPTKQCDSQWGSQQLRGGSCSNGKPGTICSAGCGPTSVSMIMRHVNGSMTPNNVIFSSGSAYANMGCEGSSLDQAQTELSKKFGSSAVTYNAATQGCDEKAIAKWICEGKVVMVLANFYRNSALDLGGHFVLAIGVRNGKIVVADPYYSATDTPFDGTRAFGYAHDIRGCLTVNKSAVK